VCVKNTYIELVADELFYIRLQEKMEMLPRRKELLKGNRMLLGMGMCKEVLTERRRSAVIIGNGYVKRI
jgi:hypothetical protein